MKDKRQKPLLLDSSVIVKWFYEEPDSPDARLLAMLCRNRKIILATSEFAYLETANALWKNGVSEDKIHLAIEALRNTGVHIFPLDQGVLHEALEYSFMNGASVYDAYFVAQADLEGLRLITADKKLARAVRGLTDVMTLEEYAARLN